MTELINPAFGIEQQSALEPDFLQGLEVLIDDPDERQMAIQGAGLPPIVHGETTVRSRAYEAPYPNFAIPGNIKVIAMVETEHGVYVGGGKVACFEPEERDGLFDERTLPFVAWTETADDYIKQGRGTQRYRDMNDLAQEYFGQVLHSDPIGRVEPLAKAVWTKLIREGYAEEYTVDNGTRYRFKAGVKARE